MFFTPRSRDIILFGASGHSKGIMDILKESKEYRVVGVFDDNKLRESVM